MLGLLLGLFDGCVEGELLGCSLGVLLGYWVRLFDWFKLGAKEGCLVGFVGARVKLGVKEGYKR